MVEKGTKTGARSLLAENVFDTLREPLLVLDASLRVQKANSAFYAAFLLPPNSIEGHSIYRIDRRRWDRPELRQLLEATLPTDAASKNFPIDFEIDGLGKRHMLLNAQQIHQSESNLRSILLALEDVTERNQAQRVIARHMAEVERSNVELEQFAYVASHDLQEPLRMVASFSELLARRYKDGLDSDAQEFIGFIVDGVHRMQALINDLLVYSRVGRRDLAFSEVDCENILETVLANLKTAIADASAVITHEKLPKVCADGMQMGQLFQNLLGNSLKFRSDKSPCIRISSSDTANEWVFKVSDNGIGMNLEESKRIFQVFQRLHARGTYPGTGIGLAICKKIVERHGGRIWVESRPGEGADFSFTLSRTRREKEECCDRIVAPD